MYESFKINKYWIKLDKQIIEKENFKHEQDHKSYNDDIMEMINLCLNSDKVYCKSISYQSFELIRYWIKLDKNWSDTQTKNWKK